jgi:hypothetical protein
LLWALKLRYFWAMNTRIILHPALPHVDCCARELGWNPFSRDHRRSRRHHEPASPTARSRGRPRRANRARRRRRGAAHR